MVCSALHWCEERAEPQAHRDLGREVIDRSQTLREHRGIVLFFGVQGGPPACYASTLNTELYPQP
jgi:hypothetical protein